jgi:hypothetical protein
MKGSSPGVIVLAKNVRTMFLVYMRMNATKKKAFKVVKF